MPKTLALALALTGAFSLASLRADETPAGSDAAVLSAPADAGVAAPAEVPLRLQALDSVEAEEAQKEGTDRQGGEALVTVILIVAVVALVYIYFQHSENMSAR